MTILALSAALFFACAAGGPETGKGAGQSGPLTDLTDFRQFADAFDGGQGSPRLVLLLSPT